MDTTLLALLVFRKVRSLPRALLALLALALGVVIGAGVVLMITAALRARAATRVQTSTALPEGLTAVLEAMDDAACAVDPSGLVVAASAAASRFGSGIEATLDNPELRQLARSVREGGTQTLSLRLTRGGASLDPRLVSARASRISPPSRSASTRCATTSSPTPAMS